MADKKLFIHPAFRRRLRHYRDRIAVTEGRPQVAERFVMATQELISNLLQNPKRGHSARFEAAELTDIMRSSVPGFGIFAVFYRWNEETLTIITIEHGKQDLPARLARVAGGN